MRRAPMFLTHLDLRATAPGQWTLLAPLVWLDETFGRVEVPAGTPTDLASVPRFLRDRKAFAIDGPSRRPAVVHDFLYARGVAFDGSQEWTVDRQRADTFLRVALAVEGVPAATAWAYYWGVRLGGWKPWNEYRRLQGQRHPE